MNDNILYVWIYPQGEPSPVVCGVLELLQGRHCLFSYDASWINRVGAFPLSPDIPLRTGVFEPPAKFDIHPVFEDAGPDKWGKNVINKVFNPPRRSQLEYLELAGQNRIGALGFSRSSTEYKVVDGASFHSFDLPELVRASEALALQMPIDDNLRRLLRPGSSAGGARPKSIIKHNDKDWIVKFLADGDEVDVCAIEHASLVLARMCGVNTVKSDLLKVGNQNALLIERFDRKNKDRVHFVSARTLLIADGIAEGLMGYADMADIARRLSSSPNQDCHELFRRMVLNVFIENTDDHEKNHAFIYRDNEWHLSPAYDVLPQLQGLGFHQMRIGKDGNEPKIANILSECSRFLLTREDAGLIVGNVLEKVAGWRDVFSQTGVSQHDIELCGKYILRNQIFQFGKVPEDFIDAAEKNYLGKIVAIDTQYAYQSLGRNVFVRHERAKLNSLVLPDVELAIRYNDGKVLVTNHSTKKSISHAR